MTLPVEQLRERVRSAPGMDVLLPALEDLAPAYLVGGVPRDLLREEGDARDLDVAVEGDGVAVAQELGRRLDARVLRHERFGTATVESPLLRVDVASTRTERYHRPGALPDVEWAPLAEDLARRDFGVNAMAIGLRGDELGHLHDPHGGLSDLAERQIRVLHERSFEDDPTRLMRAARYGARLEFEIELETERLALAAIDDGVVGTVSGPRLRDELLLLLAEVDVPGALARMGDLGLDSALHPDLRASPALVADTALGAMETGADRVMAELAALVSGESLTLAVWLDELQLPRSERDRVVEAARSGPEIAVAIGYRDRSPSQLAALLRGESPEALALALALGAPPTPILEWSRVLSRVRLEIDGADLRAAGVPEGPAIGRALDLTLERKLDGEVEGREQELAAALEAAGVRS